MSAKKKSQTTRKQRVKPAAGRDAGERTDLMDMDEAIAALKTSRATFYRWIRQGKIKGMKVGRQWRFTKADIDNFLAGSAPRVELAADITPLRKTLEQKLKDAGVSKPVRADNAVQQVVAQFTLWGVMNGTSDIHINPHLGSNEADVKGVIRCRIDGILQVLASFDIRLLAPIVEELKRMAAVDVHEAIKPQDGRIAVKLDELCPGLPDKVLDFRVCFLPAALGESVTLRVLDRAVLFTKVGDLPYNDHDMARMQKAIHLPYGIVICTGPTGSGKTTTLYACLQEVTGPDVKVMSLEDPVEYILPWVTQVPIRPQAGITFERGLRSVLRSAPNVILVGEIRNEETLQVCVQAALSGHLVMTTLHTDSAVGALRRMLDIGVDPYLIGDAVKLIVAQRLIRRLCRHCAAKDRPDAETLKAARDMVSAGGATWESLPRNYRKAVGCEKCTHTGYRGRTVISETLEVTPRVERALRQGERDDALLKTAVAEGMVALGVDGVRRFAEGETTFNEVARVLG
jgi:excisionase family DNA binding protein